MAADAITHCRNVGTMRRRPHPSHAMSDHPGRPNQGLCTIWSHITSPTLHDGIDFLLSEATSMIALWSHCNS
jgi:hypothetical protein